MPARVQGGMLGRWFEELCRIKVPRLRDAVTEKGNRLRPGLLPAGGGVYCYWWTGDRELLTTARGCNRDLWLAGPGGRKVALEIDDEWLGLAAGLPIPLYVGKSAAGIHQRAVLHLVLAQTRILPLGKDAFKAKAPTTTCQLRAGVEHLLPNQPDTRTIILDHVGLSWVDLPGDENAANRFYLEDLTIGLMRPALNVDIER